MNLRAEQRRTPIGLTPMIDVVFLLLVFFMLAARFAVEGAISVPLTISGETAPDTPRLLEVSPNALRLNGVATPLSDVPEALSGVLSDNSDIIVLRATDGADVQRVVDVLEALTAAGYSNVVLIE